LREQDADDAFRGIGVRGGAETAGPAMAAGDVKEIVAFGVDRDAETPSC